MISSGIDRLGLALNSDKRSMAASNNDELQAQIAAALQQYGDPPQASIR